MDFDRVAEKALIAADCMRHPSYVLKRWRGVGLSMFRRLNRPWVRRLGIETVIDIGANVGQFSLVIHEICPAARIYAFEPLPECYEILCRRMSGVQRFRAFNCALGRAKGRVEFFRNEFSQASSALPMRPLHMEGFPYTKETERITVDMIRLDDVGEELTIEGPMLCKIDVQGYEEGVIRGGEGMIRKAKVVIVEVSYRPLYEGQPLFHEVYSLMVSLGFDYHGNLDEFRSPMDASVLQTDAVFIKA
jgi:FkbM family methyltransferase